MSRILWIVALVAGLAVGSVYTPVSPTMARRLPQGSPADSLVFTFGVFSHTVRTSEENVVFSPLGLRSALSLALLGARSETRRQMLHTLRAGTPTVEAVLREGDRLATPPVSGGAATTIANAMWVAPEEELDQRFAEVITRWVKTSLFRHEPATAAPQINRWMEIQTQGRIAGLAEDRMFGPLTRLVLLNGVNFDGEWRSSFATELTYEDEFRLPVGASATVPMMVQTGTFRYGEGDGVRLVEIPYTANGLTLMVALPDHDMSLSELHPLLNAEQFVAWRRDMRATELELILPRLRLEAQIDFSEALSAMGMADAFGASADFSGLVRSRQLYLSAVLQRTVLELDEIGTRASAGTTLVLATRSLRRQASVQFKVDRPFFFVIGDAGSGSVVLVGQVVNPME